MKYKYLLIVLATIGLVGCNKTVYVDADGKQILKPETVSPGWKSYLETACLDGIEYWVYNPHSQTAVMAVRMATPTEAKTCN